MILYEGSIGMKIVEAIGKVIFFFGGIMDKPYGFALLMVLTAAFAFAFSRLLHTSFMQSLFPSLREEDDDD